MAASPTVAGPRRHRPSDRAIETRLSGILMPGLVNGRVLAAHGVHLSGEDVQLLAEYRVGVSHCPGSNAKFASGRADLAALRAAGVAVGLGTDGPASNDDLDLWEEMRLAAMLSRLSAMDALAMTARRRSLWPLGAGRPHSGGRRSTRTRQMG